MFPLVAMRSNNVPTDAYPELKLPICAADAAGSVMRPIGQANRLREHTPAGRGCHRLWRYQ
jgi:hypothetical protein